MIELNSVGDNFAWSNRRRCFAHVKSKLDNDFTNPKLLTLQPDLTLKYLNKGPSDHALEWRFLRRKGEQYLFAFATIGVTCQVIKSWS